MKLMAMILLLITAACASSNHAGGSPEASSYNFTIQYPDEWKRLNTERYLILTKSDPFSQYILVQQRPFGKPFKHSNKTFEKGMHPMEVANTVIEEIRSDESLSDLTVADVDVAEVVGYEGFRMVFTYKTKKGYRFKMICYGFLEGEWFYNFRYNAKEALFLEEDIDTFHQVLQSFKIH